MDDYLDPTTAVAAAAATTLVGAAAALYLTRPRALRPQVPLQAQSRRLQDDSRVSLLLAHDDQLLERLYDDCYTVYDMLRRGLRVSGDGRCLGWREDDAPYRWMRYSRVIERAQNVGSGLLASGVEAGQSSMVGIYAQNCVEWVLVEHACFCHSMVSVALYDTLGADACEYIIRQADIGCVLVDTEQRAARLLERPPACLRLLVHVAPVGAAVCAAARLAGVQLLAFDQLELLGAQQSATVSPPESHHLATISYTSGTTGSPKGVMLSHRAIMANVSAVLMQMGAEHMLCSSDVMLSFLPLSHTLERMCNYAMAMQGGAVGFFRGDIRLLMDDLKTLRPTTIPAVPRIFNRIYDKVQRGAGTSQVRSALLALALWAKRRELAAGVVRADSVWDRMVLSQVRQSLGGRVRLVVLGSAPVSPLVLGFMRAALGCLILEGYGQTECVCPCTLTMVGDHTAGHVGPPLPCCALRLVDVPDMGYTASEGRGEVCVRGPSVMCGYYRCPDKTEEALDADGWLHTGDIGQWLDNGTLRIIDRKKNIFKLSQGEYVAPERLEEIYSRAPLVSQVYVHGDSLKSCLVAVVVPERELLHRWALQHGQWEDAPLAELCRLPQLQQDLMHQLTQRAARAALKGFEKVRAVYLHPEPMTLQNGLLTATMKPRRHAIAEAFRQQIDSMYRDLD